MCSGWCNNWVTTGSSRQSLTVYIKLLPQCTRDFHTSVMLRSVDWMGLTGCFETSVTTNQRCVTSQKGEDVSLWLFDPGNEGTTILQSIDVILISQQGITSQKILTLLRCDPINLYHSNITHAVSLNWMTQHTICWSLCVYLVGI